MNIDFTEHTRLSMDGDSEPDEYPTISEEVYNAYFKMYFESLIFDFNLNF